MPTETTPNLPEQLHQQPGTEVARRSYGGSDSESLDAGDILIPRMKLAQMISRVVADGVASYGDVYILESRDDMEPTIVAAAPKKGDLGPAVRFYIHGDPRKGWSWTQPDGELGRSPQYPSLTLVKNQDPKLVRRTYDYLVTVPGYDMLPVRFLMHGAWGGQAAKQINTQLLLNRQRGIESHTLAFKLQVKKTSANRGGQEQNYVQAIIGLDKVTAAQKAKDLELVNAHRDLVGSAANVRELDEDDTTTTAPVDAPDLG
jgi:hypothetical protein